MLQDMANAIFGQLLRNARKDKHVQLVRSGRVFRKLMNKPTTKGFRIFGEDLVLVERQPSVIRMKNFPAAGVAVLDLSKLLMQRLYWRMKDQFGPRMEMLFTDTDSIGVELQSQDLCADLRPLMDILDTSSLPPDHELYDPRYARVQGRLKIEYGGYTIQRFAGITSKVYSAELVHPSGEKVIYKAKGVQRSALRRSVSFEDYQRCIFESTPKVVTTHAIRTDGYHNLYTVRQEKLALSDFDCKRYMLPCGVLTLPYGYDPLPEIVHEVCTFSAHAPAVLNTPSPILVFMVLFLFLK